MNLRAFVEMVERERPDEITAHELADVHPHPWVSRHGSGKRARIRMKVGEVKYERRQAETTWKLVDEWTMGRHCDGSPRRPADTGTLGACPSSSHGSGR